MTDKEFKQQKWSLDMLPKDILIKKNKRLEQALEEIKEIAKKQMEICSCKFDLDNYESRCRGCSSKDARIISKQILQKISEVLDD